MGTALNVQAWSTTAASNDGADSTIGTVANSSSPTTVDDWARGIMASVKKHSLDIGGGVAAVGGTANAITITTNQAISSGHQGAGFSIRFKAGATNTTAVTVAVDGLSAVAVEDVTGAALVAGSIVSGGIYDLAYNVTNGGYTLLGSGQFNGNLVFPATQVASSGANTLDDYEESTWTPGLTFGGGDTGMTFSFQTGAYTKIGRMVQIVGQIGLSAKGSSVGVALITGLPFTCSAFLAPLSGRVSGMTSGVGDTFIAFTTASSSTTVVPSKISSGTVSQLTDADFADTSSILLGGVYHV